LGRGGRLEAREPHTMKNIMMKSKEVYGFIGLSSGGKRGFLEEELRTMKRTMRILRIHWFVQRGK